MHFSSELLKGTVKNILLSVIAKKEMYGYEIVKAIREQTNELVTLGEGNIYPALHELEKKKFLKSHWIQQEGSPDRKYYKITRKGLKTLAHAQAEWKIFVKAINMILPSV